jgi:hypothetical protein
MNKLCTALVAGCLTIPTIALGNAHGAVRFEGGVLPVTASDAPRSGLVTFRTRDDAQGLALQSTWMRTGSTLMGYRDRVVVDVLDASGEVLQTKEVAYRPNIRSRGERDKVWVLSYSPADQVDEAASLRVRFLTR